MAKIIKGAEALAAEPVVAGSVVHPPGSLGSGHTGGGLVGMATAAAIKKGDKRRHGDAVRTSPLGESDRGYLALTETRLLLMLVKVGFSQKAISIITEIPRSDIVGARFEKAVLSSVVIELRDGTEWHFSAVKIDSRNARALVDVLAN